MRNAIVYYSNTNNSKMIACYLSDILGYQAVDIRENTVFEFENLVLIFPVHCQNTPKQVKAFLSRLQVKKLVLLATYGKMCYGNVLYEIQKKYALPIVGAAYIPCKHSYLKDDSNFADFESLRFVKTCLRANTAVRIKKSYQNPFANFLPVVRSQLGVKIIKKGNCSACNLCRCDNVKCIRCLKCVYACPNGALDFKLAWFMRLYLRKKKVNELVIYQSEFSQ